MPPYRPTIPKTIVSMNTLDKDVVIKGSVTFAQQLVLEGTVEGEINSAGSITVGETALVKGTIKTGSAIVFGKVEGNIIVQSRCEVKPTLSRQPRHAARYPAAPGSTVDSSSVPLSSSSQQR